MAQLAFDATTVEPFVAQQLPPLPAGPGYVGVIEKTEMKPTKDGKGAYLELIVQLLVGPVQCQGRKVYTRLNLRSENAQAQQLAYNELSAVCHAVNVLNMRDTDELLFIPMLLQLDVREGDEKKDGYGRVIGKYPDSNIITAYAVFSGDRNALPQPQRPQQAQPGAWAGNAAMGSAGGPAGGPGNQWAGAAGGIPQTPPQGNVPGQGWQQGEPQHNPPQGGGWNNPPQQNNPQQNGGWNAPPGDVAGAAGFGPQSGQQPEWMTKR